MQQCGIGACGMCEYGVTHTLSKWDQVDGTGHQLFRGWDGNYGTEHNQHEYFMKVNTEWGGCEERERFSSKRLSVTNFRHGAHSTYYSTLIARYPSSSPWSHPAPLSLPCTTLYLEWLYWFAWEWSAWNILKCPWCSLCSHFSITPALWAWQKCCSCFECVMQVMANWVTGHQAEEWWPNLWSNSVKACQPLWASLVCSRCLFAIHKVHH